MANANFAFGCSDAETLAMVKAQVSLHGGDIAEAALDYGDANPGVPERVIADAIRELLQDEPRRYLATIELDGDNGTGRLFWAGNLCCVDDAGEVTVLDEYCAEADAVDTIRALYMGLGWDLVVLSSDD